MIEKIRKIRERFDEINTELASDNATGNVKRYRDLMREHKNLKPVIDKYDEYLKHSSEFEEAKTLLGETQDFEFKEMVQSQYDEAKKSAAECAEELKVLLLPKNPDDDRNVIVEIRSGVGGDEAALFANSIYRMYSMHALSKGWKTEVINSIPTDLGGFKEISFSISGESVYAKMKYESGVHRVQRVPETETQGRIHTSAVTIAIMPEAEETDIEINPADLEFQTFRSSGAGGQHINKTESAIRVIHKPTGVVIECQEERSQQKNKAKALQKLYTKLYDMKSEEQNAKNAAERKIQVGSGDRSERIRTYNYPQGRITDHRIGLTLYKLESILNGECDELFDALRIADQAAKLAGQS